MSRATRMLVTAILSGALMPGLATVIGPPAAARGLPAGVASYSFLHARVLTAPGLGSIAVGMPDDRTVKVQRLDAATGAWSSPTVLFRSHGRLTCGDIDARISPGGVALLLECDTPYYDDQAPARSQALVSTDLVHWARQRLPGEAYTAPAIAPSGGYAAWLTGGTGEFVEWSATRGFLPPAATSFNGDGGDQTLVVDDAGTVDVVGAEFEADGDCILGADSHTLAGQRSRQVVEGVEPGCTEGDVDGVDALTVVGNGGSRSSAYVVSRPDPASPWRLTRVAPSAAPGLVDVQGDPRRKVPTIYVDVTVQPLVAVTSADRQHVLAQAYDDVAQAWGPQRVVYDAGAPVCHDAGNHQVRPWPVLAIQLRCGGGTTLLVGATLAALQAARVGTRTWTISAAGILAAPTATGTLVVSPAGSVTLPVTSGGRCDVVYAIGPTSLARVHGRAHEAWPTRLQSSVNGAAWRPVGRITMPAAGRCRRATVDLPVEPTKVVLRGTGYHSRVLRPADYLVPPGSA